jgi:hypothetical protein
LNQTSKNLDAVEECIQEAQRYLKSLIRYKCAIIGKTDRYAGGKEHAACLRSAIDVKRIAARFARRRADSNYDKPWDEVE